ncbi:MAG: DUF2905 domain-containing protein [Candidatus Zixiibacteriota bacterium]
MDPQSPFQPFGRFLIIIGVSVMVVGVLLLVLDRFGLPGRLPGDFVIRGRRWTVWIPLATSVILSVIVTILLNLFRR